MKDDYTTNSHYLTHTFLFRKVGRMYFLNLGAKGLNSTGRRTYLGPLGPDGHTALRVIQRLPEILQTREGRAPVAEQSAAQLRIARRREHQSERVTLHHFIEPLILEQFVTAFLPSLRFILSVKGLAVSGEQTCE